MTKIQNILQSLGYYRIKKCWRDYKLRKRLIREDVAHRQQVLHVITSIDKPLLLSHNDSSDVIVSLTSYGKRVSDTLPYTLYSLLQQTVKPNRIIVWLDNVKWNISNLPEILYKLQQAGVEFMFCDDVRSYKKLIPTLMLYHDNPIITVDDDMYYNPQLVEWLLTAYECSDKHTILGTYGVRVTSSENRYLPYSQWKEAYPEDKDVCLIGCGGILYPPAIFDKEILNKDVFMHLAPRADDLWFWAMAKRAGIPTSLISHFGYAINTSVDRINDYFPAECKDNLSFFNDIEGENDEQLNNLISYYNLFPESNVI